MTGVQTCALPISNTIGASLNGTRSMWITNGSVGLGFGTLAGSTAVPLRIYTRGTEAFRIDSVNPQIVAHVGSAAAPSYSFNGSQSTGFYAPAANTIGASVNGTRSMWITSGSVGLGFGTLVSDTSNNGTALGRQAMAANTTGGQNVGIGYQALQTNTTGSDNTAVGYQTLSSLNGGRENTALGSGALRVTTANDSTAIGFQALFANTTGDQNTAIGAFALKSNQGASNNVAVGTKAMANNVSGRSNVAIGVGALEFNVSAMDNVAIGEEALASNTSNANTAIGTRALKLNQTGAANTAVGFAALSASQTADNNAAFGNSALLQNIAANNTAVGSQAMRDNVSGTDNVALGLSALRSNISSADNTAIGSEAMNNTTGQKNTAIGRMALKDTSSGYNNVALGWSAGYAASNGNAFFANKTGNNNTFLGASTMPGTTSALSYATALGADAVVGTSGTIVLGRATDNTVIGATGDNGSGYKLQVTGGLQLTGPVRLDNNQPVYFAGATSGSTDKNWAIYRALAGGTNSASGGAATNALDGGTGAQLRFRAATSNGEGFVWENHLEQALMSLTAVAGDLYAKGNVVPLGKILLGSSTDDGSGNKLQVTGGIKALTGGLSVAGGDLVLGSATITGTLASRPAFGVANRIYIGTDTNAIYRDTGTAWTLLGGSSSPALSALTGATANNSINNAAYAEAWNWQLTGNTTAFNIGENAA